MSGELILVTGVTGFIAGHVAEQLLQRGYRVRGTVRSAKYTTLTKTIHVPGLELALIDDVATGDFSEALEGVDAVIHVACPLPGRAALDVLLSTAVEGTLNVVRQAEKLGITKIVVTSTFGTLVHPDEIPSYFAGLTFNESNFGNPSREDALAHPEDPIYEYFTAKTIAERALWAFVKEKPHLDVRTVLPGYAIGPYPKTFPLPTSQSTLGTNDYLYGILNNGQPPIAPNWIVDVRDVAKGHILTLLASLPPISSTSSKCEEGRRFIINGCTYTWKDAAVHLKKVRGDALEGRLVDLDKVPALPGVLSGLDCRRSREVLGFGEYLEVERTVEDAADELLGLEKIWAAKN
ncbi:hypothetical protein B0H34DRAFT_540865 [Crassisporium funariophilum]|nr:hypothetical protein B0H34DRAFT_540865 [Crassisporium funariophilum]